ncbi:unnamed protein product [Brassica oleracea var. botrytis]
MLWGRVSYWRSSPCHYRLVTCCHVHCVNLTYRIREMESLSREGEKVFKPESAHLDRR